MKLRFCATAIAVCLASQPAFAGLVITEVASTSGAPSGGLLDGLDWWELTNTGPSAVSLDGYLWEDNSAAGGVASGDNAVFPNGVSVAAGESIIIHENDPSNTDIANTFRTTWGLPASVQILQEFQFSGPNTFSGLSSGGDDVHLFDASQTEVASASFGPSTSGDTFEWDTHGTNLGLSVVGENGAFLSTYGGIGSPGTAVSVPEPAAIALLAIAFGGLVGCRRQRMD